uniref:Transducin/WD40 repeat-like superfamily protein n=1 Tax=Hordeum vulgare subsp. vulgare TaxID=112509 RepID=M0W6Z5_HORVV
MIAVVRTLDPNLLDQMYQARTQKAVVEFIWIGGQFLGLPLEKGIHICSQQSATNFLWWGSNIFWSLKKYENGERELILWDIIVALQLLKKSAPTFLETLMHRWVSSLFSYDQCDSIIISHRSRNDVISKASLRKLHLLNIVCRKVMLSGRPQYSPGGEEGNNAATDLWTNLLVSSEAELQERLVAFTFASVLGRIAYLLKGAYNDNLWFPVGIGQMDSWVSMNSGEVHDQLKSLKSSIKDLGSRIDSVCEYSVEETCPYCSAPVRFESPDVAFCGSGDPAMVPAERHKLSRCAASMRLCSVLQPAWHCACCGGMVDKLVPETFFTMAASPLDADHDSESLCLSAHAVPLCPFCGITLQRSTPAFLLSVSPL